MNPKASFTAIPDDMEQDIRSRLAESLSKEGGSQSADDVADLIIDDWNSRLASGDIKLIRRDGRYLFVDPLFEDLAARVADLLKDAGTDPEKAEDEAYRILGTVSLKDYDPKLSDLSYVEQLIHDILAETLPDKGIPDFDERLWQVAKEIAPKLVFEEVGPDQTPGGEERHRYRQMKAPAVDNSVRRGQMPFRRLVSLDI